MQIEKRIWVSSGIIEELDKRQIRLLALVYEKINLYYEELYGTRECYKYPLTLWRLMKLCNRSSYAVSMALKYLANTIPLDSKEKPLIYYDRHSAKNNKSHRPYRIFLTKPD